MSSITLLDYVQTTTLPALPVGRNHTGTSTTTPSWPRTDLNVFEEWTSFPAAVLNRRPALAAIPFEPLSLAQDDVEVTQETDVHGFADYTLHKALRRIMTALGYSGYAVRNIGGNSDVVCDPDRIFSRGSADKPLLTIEFKTPWAFPRTTDLAATYRTSGARSKYRRAVNQIYGYMTFNHHRYGVLTTYNETYFLRRSVCDDGGCLQVAGPFTFNTSTPFTVLEAYTTMLLLCIDSGFYVSPTSSSPVPSIPLSAAVSRTIASVSSPSDGYTLIDVDMSSVEFIEGRDRGASGAVIEGLYCGNKVILNLVDETKHVRLAEDMDREVGLYRQLATLQGRVIPRLLGYIRVWNMLRMIVLEDCGASVEKLVAGTLVNVKFLRSGCLEYLGLLHQVGLVHGDTRLANFVYSETGGFRVLDFGQSKFGGTRTEQSEDQERLMADFFEATPMDPAEPIW
ncbi:hypothetical protein BC832DRAFT_226509 [Gaertneriomyces semiglobifer]|nr:hypothetical protein BC832DRAFT_226509 [Gaertneriomyces semiglobifer]